MAATTNASAMWPSTGTTSSGPSANSDFSSLQDTQSGSSAVSNVNANATGWPSGGSEAPNGSASGVASSDLHAAQRPANLGALGSFGNGASGNGAGQSGTPNVAQQQVANSNLWSSSFLPQTTASSSSGWNAPASFSQPDSQVDAAWSQQRSAQIRSSWTDAPANAKPAGVGQPGIPSPTGTQSDAAFAGGAQQQVVPDASGLGALTVQTSQSGSANGGPPTNASNGDQFGAASGGASSFIRKYPRVAFEDLDESVQRLINTHDGWGRVPVDQKSSWNVEAILEQRNRLVEQFEQREAEQRANVTAGAGASAAAASTSTESNIWTNEPNTGTNIWEQSRESTAPGSSAAPYWNANAGNNANAARPNAQFTGDSWRGRSNDFGGTWEDRSVPQNADSTALHRSSSSSSGGAAGPNASSRGLQHWNSTDYNSTAQRAGGPAQRGPNNAAFGFTGTSSNTSTGPNAAGPQADFSQNFGQPGSIGVWGEEDGGTGTAQWGANDAQNGANRAQWNMNNGPARNNAAGPGWQAGSQPGTPMTGQFGQQGPFANTANAGAPNQQRKTGGWTERGGNGDKNVDDGTNLWGTNQRGPAQPNTPDWGTGTETGVWDAGTPTGLGPKRGADTADWEAGQPNAAPGRMWSGNDAPNTDQHFNEWSGTSSADQPGGPAVADGSWNRPGKPIRPQFPTGAQPGGSFGPNSGTMQQSGANAYPQNAGGNSNYDQSSMGSGGGYQRAKLLSRLTSQGFSREEAQAALIRNNMDYDRTLSELNRQRIQSGMPVGLPPMANAGGVPIRGLGSTLQHESNMGAHFGQFDATPAAGDQNAMLMADLLQKQAPNAFLNNQALLNQQHMNSLLQSGGAGANAAQQKLLAGGPQAGNPRAPQLMPGGGPQQQAQAARMPNAQNNNVQQQPTAPQLSAPHLQALSQLPPAQMAILQQYVKMNTQAQQLVQQRAAAPTLAAKNELGNYIDKVQAQLKLYEQQLLQLQAQQRFNTPASGAGSGNMQKQPNVAAQQSSSRINQWINADASQAGDVLAASVATSNSFAGIADSIPEFVPGKPWPGVQQYSRDLDLDPNVAAQASMAQQRQALANRQLAGVGNMPQQAAAVAQAPQQNATTYLLLRNVTQSADMGVLRQVAAQFGKVTSFVPVAHLAICVIAYATRSDAEKARAGFAPLASRGISMELLSDPELTRVLQQAAANVVQPQQAPGGARGGPGGDRTATPTGSGDSSLLPNGLLNS